MTGAEPRALALDDLNLGVDDEPRIEDLRLAEALGFNRPRVIRDLLERHVAALERLGRVCRTARQTSERGGRPGRTYWLNKRQALYVCTKSETPRATEVTIEMVEVFDAHLLGTLKTVRVEEHRRRPPRRAAAPRAVDLPTALARHAAASQEADASLSLRDRDVERWARREGEALAELDEALTRVGSPDDVAAVVAHAYDQGGRAAEPGAQVMVLHRLIGALTLRAFGREAEAFAAAETRPALPLAA